MADEQDGILRRWWAALRKPSAKYSILAIFAVSFVAGIVFWGGFNTGMEATNTLGFCITCHEMRDNVYAEYQDTIHDKNRVGGHVACADCHVPHEPGPLIWRKVNATFEIWGKLTGVIDTKEKFRAHRAELAKRVWTRMLTTNSLECRNCHKIDAFDPDKQSDKGKAAHAKAEKLGMTCSECRYAIAHDEPKGPGPQELKKALGIGPLPWKLD